MWTRDQREPPQPKTAAGGYAGNVRTRLLRHGQCEAVVDCGILTFVVGDRGSVDEMYGTVGEHNESKALAIEKPHENERYDIHQFFAEDPDGRTAEFQAFLHDLPE